MKLQYPLGGEHLPRQSLFRRRRLIEGFGERLEDGFYDVVRIAANRLGQYLYLFGFDHLVHRVRCKIDLTRPCNRTVIHIYLLEVRRVL